MEPIISQVGNVLFGHIASPVDEEEEEIFIYQIITHYVHKFRHKN